MSWMNPTTANMIELNDGLDWLVWRSGSGPTVEIYDVAVNSARRQGFGRRLVDKLLEAVPRSTKSVWAVTRANNIIATEWYAALGFSAAAVLEGFYGDGEDAVMYLRPINRTTGDDDGISDAGRDRQGTGEGQGVVPRREEGVEGHQG